MSNNEESQFIPIREIHPRGNPRGEQIDKLLNSIPRGQAFAVAPDKKESMRQALYRRQRMGRFTHLRLEQRNYRIYILFPIDAEKEDENKVSFNGA